MRTHRSRPCHRPLRAWLAAAALLLTAAAPDAGGQTGWSPDADDEAREVLIRILPPLPGRQPGTVRVETLVTDPQVHNVVFLLDGEVAARRRSPPWAATLRLDSPPREQLVRAEARDADDYLLAADELTVNRRVERLAVALRSIEPAAGGLAVRAEVSLPDAVELDRLELFFNLEPRRSWTAGELAAAHEATGPDNGPVVLEVTLEAAEPAPQDYVRLVARLADGRVIEDVGLVSGRDFTERVDVRLVQLQVVVTNRRGLPMRGLSRKHFRITENGRDRPVAGLFPADDVALLLGLALDSSGSMRPIWPQTREAAASFLADTMRDRDEGFLVDFDTRLRLIEAPTADRPRLIEALAKLEPEGGTALYDSILFSLLQFDRQQGRRGLVVLTDGYDVESQADPERAIEFGKRLGVPIYILALDSRVVRGRAPTRGISTGIDDLAAAVQTLRLVTEPTGGRLFRVGGPEQVIRAFKLINAELRNQYVLTYYTDTPPEPGSPPDVRIEAPGHDGLRAKVVFGADQVY